jgi:CheY-like chemotaxis protein
MNHELRTPLNAVLLYSESLQTQLPGPLNERQLRAVGGIRESAHHLLLLINDILDVAKMDAGKLSLDILSTSIESICQSSLRLVSEMAQKKRLDLRYQFNPNITQLDVDERRLKQMLVNLLSNAIKFTQEDGQIGLEVNHDAESEVVHFTVWDTGIGLSAEDMKKLFQPFVQLDSSHARHHGGTGLGLFLVYRMAELHGGSVSVTSEVNLGSRFTISLPLHQQPQPPLVDMLTASHTPQGIPGRIASKPHEHPANTIASNNGDMSHPGTNRLYDSMQPFTVAANESVSIIDQIPTILIADDNEANLRVLSDFLQEWHCRILIARTGIEAVQQTKEELPNLVLMDIQMPEMNGLDAIRTIRAELSLSHIPIVALTALAMPGDREQCLAAGANDYLSKPIQIERLTEILNIHLRTMLVKEAL